MDKFSPIKSSFLLGGRYDAENQCCEVQFKSGTYRYSGVTPEIWNGFEKTFQTDESSGTYLRKHIKPLESKKIS